MKGHDIENQRWLKEKAEAKEFLRKELGIRETTNQPGKYELWTCLSCLLSQFFNVVCQDPEGDEKFAKEIELSHFEIITK